MTIPSTSPILNQAFRILVCEDDDNRFRYFQRALIGSSLNRAKTPAEAIQHLKDLRYDVVFLDYDYDDDHSGRSGFGNNITKYILDNSSYFGDIAKTLFVVHSSNKEGRWLMSDDLIEAGQEFIMMRPMEWKSNEFDLTLVREWVAMASVKTEETKEYRRPNREAVMDDLIKEIRHNHDPKF